MELDWHRFPDPETLAEALASTSAALLTERIVQRGRVSLALSGGRTPRRFLEALSRQTLPWAGLVVTLVDERWVEEGSERSNARLLREHLLKDQAAVAEFLPLTSDDATPEEGREAVEAAVARLPLPLGLAVLGLGEDGHTASYFSGGDRLAEALEPPDGRLVETQRATAAGEPRITLTLPVLLAAEHLILHIEGEAKRRVLEEALRPGPVEELPIRAVLQAPGGRLQVFWCP